MSDHPTTPAHEQHESFHEDILYPEHVQRTESSEFRANKHLLVHQLDLGCWICGSKQDREVHHFASEWSLWDSLDPALVLDTVLHIDPYGYAQSGRYPEPNGPLREAPPAPLFRRAYHHHAHLDCPALGQARRCCNRGPNCTRRRVLTGPFLFSFVPLQVLVAPGGHTEVGKLTRKPAYATIRSG